MWLLADGVFAGRQVMQCCRDLHFHVRGSTLALPAAGGTPGDRSDRTFSPLNICPPKSPSRTSASWLGLWARVSVWGEDWAIKNIVSVRVILRIGDG